jgi:hypothetical protein
LEITMTFTTALIASATALFATAASAQIAPEIIRGQLSPELLQLANAPAAKVQVATCPAGFNEVFENQKLSCERHIRQLDDVKCPSSFPNFTARNVSQGTDRDLCAKAGINISSDGSLANFRNGTDYVFIPANGVRNGTSFLARHPNATAADGWTVNTSNAGASGIIDRYQRVLTIKRSPILVNP